VGWKSWVIAATVVLMIVGIAVALFNLPIVTGDVPA
jgi:hypothetical protein